MSLAMFGLPGGWEWIALLVIGLLLFGKRLPEVGRSIGQAIVEFKRGVRGVTDEIDTASREDTRTSRPPANDYRAPSAPPALGDSASTGDPRVSRSDDPARVPGSAPQT